MILVDIPVSEPFSTELALVGLVFTVNDFVGAHLIEPLERLVTDIAMIGPSFCEK